ncbi:hypothetical protein VTI74DRAFT_4807 [Chaetomium olivicolor]
MEESNTRVSAARRDDIQDCRAQPLPNYPRSFQHTIVLGHLVQVDDRARILMSCSTLTLYLVCLRGSHHVGVKVQSTVPATDLPYKAADDISSKQTLSSETRYASVAIMSKLFRSRHSAPKPLQESHSAYSSLLDPTTAQEGASQQLTGRAPPSEYSSKTWLTAAENRPSWTAERPPTRKLVKDMNGYRPSFSFELSDSDAEKEKGIVRRQISRLKGLYKKEK